MRSMLFAVTITIFAAYVTNADRGQQCPAGFTDTGMHCLKPASYGRGFGNRTLAHCEEDYGVGSCEKCFSLFYPVCDESFQVKGCNVCEPQCPPNMTDIGLSCQK